MSLLNKIRLWNQLRLVNLYTIEIDENVNEIKQLNLAHGWIYGTVEWDEIVKLDYTTEFVTLLNKCDCWKRWKCKPR